MADETPVDLTQFIREQELRKTLDRTLISLERAKASKAELVDAVERAAADACAALTIPPVPKPKKDTRKKTAEVALAVMSDWQLAKVTPTYNSEVCEQRIEEYGDKVINLAEIQRADHPVRELHVDFVGDEVEGELIFPGQQHLIDASLFEQVCVSGPRITANLLRKMASNFDIVRVRHADGNHGALGGRARKDYHPETNADSMMLKITEMLLEGEKRIIFDTQKPKGERHWYDVDQIFDHRFLMFHADQVKGGFGGFPWYGFGKKLQGWYNTLDLPDEVKPEFEMRFAALTQSGLSADQLPNEVFKLAMQMISGGPFKYGLGGHFHTPVRFYMNGITYWGNGSTESNNTYALESLAASGEPSQWLLFVHPDGVSAEYLVHLT